MNKKIDAVIFDLGGVILNLDYQATTKAFHDLGFTDFDVFYSQASQAGLFDAFELGEITEEEFFRQLNKIGNKDISFEELKSAWNAMLLSFNPDSYDIVERLGRKIPIYLYSNTNETHYARFNEIHTRFNPQFAFDDLFERTYYSHLYQKRKPHPSSFFAILEENNLIPEHVVFVDDSMQHVEGAKSLGIQAYHLKEELKSLVSADLSFLLA